MPKIRRSGPPPQEAANAYTATESNAHNVIHAALPAESVWEQLEKLDGSFRIAVPCCVCGRYLTSSKSKALGMGPACAAKAVPA